MTATATARILIVEDEALVAEDLKVRLTRLGYEVVGILDRAEGVLTAAIESKPDLVLMDIKLKGKWDGIDAAQRLRALHRVPFVYLTSFADQATIERARQTEPFGYVVKPFDERSVHAAVEIALSRHRSEIHVRSSEQRLRTILRSIGDAVVVTDESGRITFLNPSGEALSRWPAVSALGEPFATVFPLVRGEDGARVPCPVTAALRSMSPLSLEPGTRLVARDGETIPVDDTVSPLPPDGGASAGAVVVMRDASVRERVEAERLASERRLAEARRIEGLSRLVNGLAHDFGNMMTAVSGNAELLAHELPRTGESAKILSALESSARAAAELCARLRGCGSNTTERREPVQIRQLIESTAAAVAVLLGKATKLDVEVSATLPRVPADPVQVRQMVMNLLVNAAEAIGSRPGRIVVRAGLAAVPPAKTTLPPSLPDGAYLYFEVVDDGPGMSDETRLRAFDPFYSTKDGHQGFGLAGTLAIVRGHGGAIAVESAVGAGTTMRVLLPLAPAATRGSDAAPGSRGRTVLVVDDDALVRGTLRRVAGAQSLMLAEAESAQRALRILETESAEIGVVLIDMHLPDMHARELVRRIRNRWPQIAAVLMARSRDEAERELAGVPVLVKPFDAEALLGRLFTVAPHVVS